MRGVIAAAVLLVAVSVAGVVVWRLQRRDAIERALGRDLQPGMPLVEVTTHLRRLKVEFTVDSTTEGTAIVRVGREVARDGTITEQQIVFDAQERLHGMRSVAQIMSR